MRLFLFLFSLNLSAQTITFPVAPLYPAAGSNTQVQYNSSGALAGATGITSNGNSIQIATASAPSSTNEKIHIYSSSQDGGTKLSSVTTGAYPIELQGNFGMGSRMETTCYSTTITSLGSGTSSSGTIAYVSQANTNAYTQMKRVRVNSSTALSTSGVILTAPILIGTSSETELKLTSKFGLPNGSANGWLFVGLSANSTVSTSTTYLSTGVNLLGIGYEQSDANLSIFHNDASGTVTKVGLGSNFPASTDKAYIAEFIVNNSNVFYKISNLSDNQFTTGTISTNMPSGSTSLYGYESAINITGSAAHGIDYCQMHIQTNY